MLVTYPPPPHLRSAKSRGVMSPDFFRPLRGRKNYDPLPMVPQTPADIPPPSPLIGQIEGGLSYQGGYVTNISTDGTVRGWQKPALFCPSRPVRSQLHTFFTVPRHDARTNRFFPLLSSKSAKTSHTFGYSYDPCGGTQVPGRLAQVPLAFATSIDLVSSYRWG